MSSGVGVERACAAGRSRRARGPSATSASASSRTGSSAVVVVVADVRRVMPCCRRFVERASVLVELHVERVVLGDAIGEAGAGRRPASVVLVRSGAPTSRPYRLAELVAELVEARLQPEQVEAGERLLRQLEPLARVRHRREHAVARPHLLGRERQHPRHVVLDHRVEAERVLVDLDERACPRSRPAGGARPGGAGTTACARPGARSTVIVTNGAVEQLDGPHREVAGEQADLLAAGRPPLLQVATPRSPRSGRRGRRWRSG